MRDTTHINDLIESLEANTMHLLILANWIGKILPAYQVKGALWQLQLIVRELDKLEIISAFLDHKEDKILLIYPGTHDDIKEVINILFNSKLVGIPDVRRIKFKEDQMNLGK